MSEYILSIIQYILIFIAFIFLIVVIRFNNTTKKEKRIAKYSLDPLSNDNESIYETINNSFRKLTMKISKILSKSVFITKYSKRYEKYIDYSNDDDRTSVDLISIKLITAIIGVIILLVFDIFRGTLVNAGDLFFVLVCGFFAPNIFYIYNNKLRKKQVEEDLLKAVIIINNAFKSGRTIVQAVGIVKDELTGPISDEFRKIYFDLSYGLSVEVVFGRFAKRIDSPQASYIASSLTILNKTGGNIVKVFNSIEKYFFNQQKLKAELKSLTAAAKAIFKVLLIIPLVLCLLIFVISPEYFYPLFTSTTGIILLFMILIIYVVYIVVIRKVMDVRM